MPGTISTLPRRPPLAPLWRAVQAPPSSPSYGFHTRDHAHRPCVQSRDEAYRVICSAWCRVSAYAKLFLGAVPCDQRIRDGPPVLTTPERSRPKLESMGEAPDAESMMSELIGTKSAMPALAQPASKSEPAIHQSVRCTPCISCCRLTHPDHTADMAVPVRLCHFQM